MSIWNRNRDGGPWWLAWRDHQRFCMLHHLKQEHQLGIMVVQLHSWHIFVCCHRVMCSSSSCLSTHLASDASSTAMCTPDRIWETLLSEFAEELPQILVFHAHQDLVRSQDLKDILSIGKMSYFFEIKKTYHEYYWLWIPWMNKWIQHLTYYLFNLILIHIGFSFFLCSAELLFVGGSWIHLFLIKNNL